MNQNLLSCDEHLEPASFVSEQCFRSCDGNVGFFHGLIFAEVSELDCNVRFAIGSASGLICVNVLSTIHRDF